MKKLVQINVVCNGSTGKIMGDIQRKANSKEFDTLSFYGRKKGFSDLNCKRIGSNISVFWHAFITYVFNRHGHGSYFATKKAIDEIKKFNPDIIHLHNIHGYYLNYKVLFKYLKNKYKGKIIWTLHDCWSFTGHCAYFDYVDCQKWQNKCNRCPQKKSYPFSWFFDTSKSEYNEKKKHFTNINNLTIVTPSEWLSKLIKHSYLRKYPTIVINNGINLKIFKNTYDPSIKSKYNIPIDKRIILGVANVWEKRKGLDIFFELSELIDSKTIIVLVGLSESQIKKLPKNIVGIKRTDNIEELVKIYSSSDVFVNPTKEDNYPTTNIEAIACGTPVITFNTGGCPEQINKTTGVVIKNNNTEDLLKEIKKMLNMDFKNNRFDNSAVLKFIDSNYAYDKIISLYEGDEL